MSKPIYLFPDTNSAPVSEVGGKGYSLILGSQAGLPVPSGFILSVTFFTPWFQALQKTKQWTEFLQAKPHELEKACNELKHQVTKLAFTSGQEQELSLALQKNETDALFAVRSSSPEEDLEGSSFAGGYETVLGVTKSEIHSAIKKAFASCLDYRVAVYKRKNGFAVKNPKIAIIVQQQIASDIAGVGFSLNPVTNNYDEAVFNANWGLGETVVAGIATPDTYTVNKITLKIGNKQLGKKEQAIFLTASGGTKQKKDVPHDTFTLSDQQIVELTKLVKQVEALYKKPIDIEWAYEKEKLFLLQARPITTYIPLPKSMQTAPSEKKRLYLDATISVQGIYEPLSITGSSFFVILMRVVGKNLFFRDITKDITLALPWIVPGRIYLNLSNVLKLVGKKKFSNFAKIMDPLAAKTIAALNEKDYVSESNKLRLLPIGLLKKMPGIALRISQARSHPEKIHQQTQEQLKTFTHKAQQLAQADLPLTVLTEKLVDMTINDVFLHTVPLFIIGKHAMGEMKKIVGKEFLKKLDSLDIALPNNVTTEMGLALYRVSQLLPPKTTQDELKKGIKEQTLPPPFLSAWKEFLYVYGCRGPAEIDVAAQRYHDDPKMLLQLMLSMHNNEDNPQADFENQQLANEELYQEIYGAVKKRNEQDAKKFASSYNVFHTFAGYREAHKLYLVMVTDLIRQKVMALGKEFVQEGRLGSEEQVFYLTLEQLDQAKEDKSFTLLEKVKTNKRYIDTLKAIPQLPTIIDSRGRILRPPPPPMHEGEVLGTPISPGIYRGKIKILHTSDEKPLKKGEILVARATDPGWTPLFVNAGALILEIGGTLQHGALVAREYGLPCVAGVENATSLWKDGTYVEIDGTAGVVRVIKDTT